MAERSVVIKISAQDQFSTVIQKYQAAVRGATQDTKDFDQAAGQSTSGVDNLAKSVNTMVGAWILAQGLNMAGELNNIGAAANKTESTFIALSGGAANATTNLQLLRDATQGTVDDMSLQVGASKLFSMQLAQTGEEAAKMANVAVTLGRAMGEEAGPAIENFALMLSNTSLLRLDSIGISSAVVRDRMKELAETFPDMDKQARFTQATMEAAEKTLNRLGDSANANASNLDNLGTTLRNLRDDAGQGLNTVLNEAAGSLIELLDIAGKIRDFGLENVVNAANGISLGDTTRADLMSRIATQQDVQQIYDAVIRDFNNGANSQFILDFIVTALEETRNNPALKENTTELARTVMMDLIESGKTYEDANAGLAEIMATGVIQIQATNDSLREQKQAALDAAAAFYAYDEAFAPTQAANVNETLQNRVTLLKQSSDSIRDFYGTDEAFAPTAVANVDRVAQGRVAAMKRAMDEAKATYSTAMSDMANITGAALGNVFQYQGGMNAGLSSEMGNPLTMMQSMTDYQISAMPDYLRPEQAEQLALAYSDVEAEFERLKALNEEGLITDEQLSQAEIMKGNIKAMADEAGRAADNFANMKLPEAFGQSSGGMAGQITDDVLKRMKDSGNYTDEQIAAFQQTAGLTTGTETQASVAYEEQVLPLIQDIYNQLGAQAAADAMMNVQSYLQNAKLQGLTPGEIAKNLPNATGYSYTGLPGGQEFTIQPGQTPGAVATQLGVPVSQVIGAAGASSAYNVQPGTYTLGSGVAPIAGFTPGMMGTGQEATTAGGVGSEDMTEMTRGYDEMADSTDTMRDNFDDISGQLEDIGGKASAFADTMDLAAAAREMLFTVNLKDNTNGFLQLMLNSGQFATLSFTGGGSGAGGGMSVRDNGGRVPGVDGRVGQRAGIAD